MHGCFAKQHWQCSSRLRQSTARFIQVKWNLGGYDGEKGIEIFWGARFFLPFQTGPVAHSDSCVVGTVSFPGGKEAVASC